MNAAIPTDLVRALAAHGLRLAGTAGLGGSGPRWVATDGEGARFTVTVLPGTGPGDRLARRLAVLDRLRHPGLAGVAGVLRLAGERAVLCSEVPGADLLTVSAARGRWRAGEVVTVIGALAEAVAALHGAGLAHGDVAPANVVLRPDGAPVLVDLLGGHDEAGTAAFAAPERASGPATAAADVFGLAATGLWLLAGADEADAVRAVLREATGRSPAGRPLAAELARRLVAAHAPEPVGVPDAGALAVAGLRRLAGDRAEPAPTVRRAAHARHRRRSSLSITLPVGLLVIGATIAVTTGALGGPGAARAAGPGDPLTAAVRLTELRAEALVAGDPVALAAVTVPGSAAARADRATAHRVSAMGRPTARGGVVGAPVHVAVGQVGREAAAPGDPRPDPSAACPGASRVRIAAAVTTQEARAPTGPGVVVVLCPGRAGWRVSAVEP